MNISNQISVLIVDDHDVVRQGLEAILANAPTIRLVRSVSSGTDALSLLVRTSFDVVLLDLRMPDGHGLDVLAKIRKLSDPPRVLIVTSHEGDAMVARALVAGATGFVSKSTDGPTLIAAVISASRGVKIVSASLGRKIVANQGFPGLTDREAEVLTEVSRGLGNREIGETLGCSEKTVKNHLNSIFVKLDASDRTHAVMIALERGLIGQ
jgi:DNA-binding NarL/FixJ family response regulator